MSITGCFWRLDSGEWSLLEPLRGHELSGEELGRTEDAFLDVLFEDRWLKSERYLDVEKSWHLLDYLLRHVRDDSVGILGRAIQGGRDLPFEDYDGYFRFLDPDEVRTVAARLSDTSVEGLQTGFDLEVLRRAEIYPGFDQWEADTVRSLIEEYIPPLVAFYREAARANQYVVLARL